MSSGLDILRQLLKFQADENEKYIEAVRSGKTPDPDFLLSRLDAYLLYCETEFKADRRPVSFPVWEELRSREII